MAEDQGISWHIETHRDTERSTDWYWGLGLVALVAAGLAVFFGNALLAVIIFLSAGSLGVLAARGPRVHEVKLSPRGISLDGTLYRWGNIESFWVQEGRDPHLLVSTKGILHPQLVVPLGEHSRAQNARAYAKRYSAEVEQDPHMGHTIVEMFGL